MKKVLPVTLLKISLGVFFVILGLMGVLPTVDESVFTLSDKYLFWEAIFGVVEMACGAFIIATFFTFFTKKVKHAISIVILVFWGLRIFISKIVLGFVANNSGIWFLPDFPSWILVLSCELIIAACLWLFVKSYEIS